MLLIFLISIFSISCNAKKETVIKEYQPVFYTIDSTAKDTVLIVGKCTTFVNYNTIEKKTILKLVSGTDTIANFAKAAQEIKQDEKKESLVLKYWKELFIILGLLFSVNVLAYFFNNLKNKKNVI